MFLSEPQEPMMLSVGWNATCMGKPATQNGLLIMTPGNSWMCHRARRADRCVNHLRLFCHASVLRGWLDSCFHGQQSAQERATDAEELIPAVSCSLCKAEHLHGQQSAIETATDADWLGPEVTCSVYGAKKIAQMGAGRSARLLRQHARRANRLG